MSKPMREKQLQQAIVDYAKARGFMAYHTYDSRKSTPGFPDLVLIRRERLVAAELKVGKNKPTKAQLDWLEAFAGAGAETYVWYDTDWLDGTVERLLRGEAA